MKRILRVIKKIVVWLGYIILAVTAVVFVIVISEDDVDAQKVGTPNTPQIV
jgi:hypothetical protein